MKPRRSLSILIPVYRDTVVRQVRLLSAQCRALEARGLQWEIVVADDGSPAPSDTLNDAVAGMEGCRLVKRVRNVGRAAIRNFLAREAKYGTLLFQDSGVEPCSGLVADYLDAVGMADVVCGGVRVSRAGAHAGNLRWRYEREAEGRLSASRRNRSPYRSFRSTNFLIRREVMLRCPFDERMREYGYEDVRFGRALRACGATVRHIPNPVCYTRLEDNAEYLRKVKESLHTLYVYRCDLDGYSALLGLVRKLQRLHLLWLPQLAGRCCGRIVRANLSGRHPSLVLFALYRVCVLAGFFRQR